MSKSSGKSTGTPRGNARDAGNGRFVTKSYAKSHPRTTVIEAPKKGKK